MRVVGLIPARAGSKGLLHKNRREVRGRPLWALAEHIAAQTCDGWYVSTDDPEIVSDCTQALPRPPELAQDDTPMLDVVKHFLSVVQCDLVVLLQPTQPLRRVEHVRAALDLMRDTDADSVVSVVQIPAHMSPDYACEITRSRKGLRLGLWSSDPEQALPLGYGRTRRQDCEPAYYRDGTVYVLKPSVIAQGSLYGENVVPLVIPPDQSCSIDTEDDWRRAEMMASA